MDKRILADPGTPAFQVAQYPFFLLNRLVGRYNKVIGRNLQKLDLDIPTWRVLMILGEASPQSVRDIALAAVIPLSTMTRIIQRMEAAGYVRLTASSNDARVTEVSLSPLGRTKTRKAREAAAPIYRQLIADIDETEFDKLLDLLRRLYANLDK